MINVLLFAVFVFVLVELISMQLEIAQKKSELNEINGSLETILVSNDQLKRYYAEENRKEYIEQIARDQLDYSYADETVYYFVPK
ncbi:MAG: septum formation initiator [Ruminococcaceae bacterium]|nr:septum formation initiator [Oscillospiraceae bacterium]MBD5117468.1 septum formation initiator [Oscillospiraceae bacterium]